MQIRIAGNANLTPMKAQFAQLTAQINAMNAAMERSSLIPAGGSAAGFKAQQRALAGSNAAFAQALAATGQFRVETLKLNDVVDKNTQLLQKQKLTAKQIWGKSGRQDMKNIYREQLAMRQAWGRTVTGAVSDGRLRTTMAIPTEVHKSWDTLNNKVGMFRHELKSASGSLVNWGKNTQWAGRQMMAGISMPIAAFGAAAGVMAYQVDKQMTRIQKVYDTTANASSKSAEEQLAAQKELADLRVAGMETGVRAAHEYGAAITDTLQVQAELAATGQRGLALQQNTNEVMRISMLGEIDHARTTSALIALQSTLGMTVKETSDAFNYMNAIENATSLTMDDFAEAIPRALAPMKAMGGGIEELGLLLVAMRERGIEAGEGANAIKAMMQRIFRPSPQIKKEWMEMMHIDLDQLVSSSDGNIMEILPKISAAMKDLSRPERTKALAGLFGTYQVTRMSAMLDGIEDMNMGIGQMGRALDVNQQSWQDWAQIAEREQKKAAQSASGQFKRALEGLKAELALIGDPFLEVATGMLKAFGFLANLFNKMPDWAKKASIIAAILIAMVGPLVMLTGLFANFAGSMGKMIASSLRLVSNFELLNKAQWATKVSTALVAQGFETNASRAQVLTQQMNALTFATESMAAAMAKATGTPLPAGIAASLAQRQGMATTGYNSMLAKDIFAGIAPQAAGTGRSPNPKANLDAIYATNAKLSQTIAENAAEETKSKAKTKQHMQAGAIAGAAMAASMVTMMATENQTANSIAKWVMISSIAVPAIVSLKPVMVLLSVKSLEFARNMAAAAAASYATAGGAKGTAKGILTSLVGVGRLMGPVGWISTAVIGIGVGLFAWKRHLDAVNKAQIEAQRRISNMATSWGSATGKVLGQYKQIREVGLEIAEQKERDKTIDYYRSGEGKKDREAFEDLNADEELLAAQKMFTDLQVISGMTARQAKSHMEALFIAIGNGSEEARLKAVALVTEIGELANINWGDEISRRIEAITTDNSGNETVMRDLAKDLGLAFSQGFEEAAPGSEAQALFGQIKGAALKEWDSLFREMSSSVTGQEVFKNLGIKSAEEFSEWFRKAGDPDKEILDILANADPSKGIDVTEFTTGWEQMMYSAEDYERAVAGGVAESMKLGGSIDTIQELQEQIRISAKMLSYQQAIDEANRLAIALAQMPDSAYEMFPGGGINQLLRQTVTDEGVAAAKAAAEATAKQKLDQIILVNGLAKAKDLDEAIYNIVHHITQESKDASSEIDNVDKKLRNLPNYINIVIKEEQIAGIRRDAMEGVASDMADRAMSRFDTRMNSALDSAQSTWDNKIEGQQNAQERAMDRFDARWERRKAAVESYYDKRIEAVDKAIEAEQKAEEIRQRIFEAEQQRLQRLTEMANRSIDFNVALQTGDLDEAAKIKNDMDATATEWALSDAAAAGGTASEKRIDKLEGKKDTLEEQRDRELAALEKREEAERKHLERLHEMRADALREQADQNMDYIRKDWEQQKQAFEDKLELFQALPAANQKQLLAALKAAGLTLKDFGINTLDPRADAWGKYFENHLKRHMRLAGAEIAADNMWTNLGEKGANKILQGMGFNSMAKFERFIATGQLPADFGEPPKGPKETGPGIYNPNQGQKDSPYRHSGGWAGKDAGSRVGVARTLRGNHPSELTTTLREGEFIVNRDSAKTHAQLLEDINSGKARDSRLNVGNGVGGGAPGPAGLFGAVMAAGIVTGVGRALRTAYENKMAEVRARNASIFGKFGMGRAGMYGDRMFGIEQLRNAATIANVGSNMGMSKRDIMIGIMTAITESGLVNVKYGDRDSLGLFQQRPSQGWGTAEQVTNPEYAARKFFSVLKGVTDRAGMTPWAAAQAVQRSAFSDGSNYKQYWDEAQAIFASGLTKSAGGGVTTYAPGSGGWHKASTPGKGWVNSHDYRNGMGSPLYAVSDGTIVESRDIRSGGNSWYPGSPPGYTSYGVTVLMRTASGDLLRYAHLQPGTRIGLGPVKGGTMVGRSGMTGNASGPHTHFDVNGDYDARGWFQKHGIGLKNGGYLMSDGMANLHKEEVVVDKVRTEMLFKGIENFANGGNSEYNVNVYVTEPGASAEEIVQKTISALKREEKRKPTKRTSD